MISRPPEAQLILGYSRKLSTSRRLLTVHSPVRICVAAVLLHMWNVRNEMTRKQSCCCSGVAPDLEYTVLLQRCTLLQIWPIYLEFSQRFFMILESSSPSSLRSQAHLLSSRQSGHF